jgi:hypothetical protein
MIEYISLAVLPTYTLTILSYGKVAKYPCPASSSQISAPSLDAPE